MKKLTQRYEILKDNINGRVGVPILMYLLGVPGIVCVLAWLFFFKNT